jgi:hypothetical protein
MNKLILATLATAFTANVAIASERVTPPPVPANIQVPAGNKAFLVGHAFGTQNYICVPSAASASGVAYSLFTPEATLFSDDSKEIITHFFSPNPFEKNTNPAVVAAGPIRATWQHSRDASTVWAKVDQNPDGTNASASSTDSPLVKQGAVAWLRLKVVGQENGPTGGDKLTKTTFIQRVNTAGGVAPSTGCNSSIDVGNQAFESYTADYFFYTDEEIDAGDAN